MILISGDDADEATISGIVQAFSGGGNDVVVYVNSQQVGVPNAVARVDGDATLANLYGNQGDDQLSGGVGVDALYGGQGSDTVIDGGSNASFGNKGDDLVVGSDSDDVLYGNQDIDVLSGGAGDDTLYGGQNQDALTGGAGDDLLFGGKGEDTYVYLGGGEGDDVVNGFVIGEDVIQVTAAVAGDPATLQSSGIVDTVGGAQISFADGTTVTLEGITAQDVLDNFDNVFSIV
ncbi:MAG: calcium-binding protein [Pseudomonadota bacterium]